MRDLSILKSNDDVNEFPKRTIRNGIIVNTYSNAQLLIFIYSFKILNSFWYIQQHLAKLCQCQVSNDVGKGEIRF